MKKVIEFFKKKYKLLIPVMVFIVLLLTIFFLYREYKYDNTRNKEEVEVYQYFGGVRVDYTSIFTYNLRNSIVDVRAKDKKIESNTIPIYYTDKSKVVFPVEMSIVFPLRDGSQFKLYKYATYYNEDDVHFIKNSTDLGTYNDFFLYNGKDVFFFPEDVVLKINGKDYKELGAMSYVSVVGGYTLIYYDTKTDESEAIELDGDIVTVVGDNINVNINERYFYSFSNKILLMSPNNLNPVFKTIDK